VDHSLRRNDQFCQDTLKKLKVALGGAAKKSKKAPADMTVELFVQPK
jgi:hypothetical protein